MSRRDNAALRCPRCRLHGSLCVCSLIPEPPLVTRTRLVLVIHRNEDRKPTNTGRLAAECLAGSRVLVRGREERPGDRIDVAQGTQPLLLFPHEDAVDLAEYARERDPVTPVTLVVPDGNWRQAFKVRSRVGGLDAVPCVKLPPGAPSRYRLRTETHDGGLATIEAIARAFALLEGGDAGRNVQRVLERVLAAMVERTLWARGSIGEGQVAAGIPPGAERHDPSSGG